jgi:hypothetical protein
MLFLNLFLVAGLGRRVTTLRFVEELRMGAGVDLTVVAAVVHAVLLVALFAWVARPRGAAAGSDAAGPAAPSPNQ